jgi:hypothetical protein
MLDGRLSMSPAFEREGFTVVDRVVSDAQCDSLVDSLPQIDTSGSRTLLALDPFRQLAESLREGMPAQHLKGLVAVECILFRKSAEHNWAVRLHRDAVLPVQGHGAWPASGTKEGLECARPPREFMDKCVAVRVHLDGAPFEDISVVPGSHLDTQKHDRSLAKPVTVPRGGALVMRPTLAHASSKLEAVQQRRVLHFVFAPKDIPQGYAWYDAA